ncbi:hypothetical protein COO60DRAFT_812564 [Scenedesmus sp. NREL 46B-D3]|nr:hypothetical protein COO60DRAFT_812564 [Scenedesmus sp. NREL 46B-D3]
MVASEVQQQQHQHDEHHHQQPSGHPAQQRKPCWLIRACQYAKANPLELASGILESITLVLVVFVQDIAFKQAMVICAALLTASFILHGLAFRAGQCQVWPKVIEIAAPLLFYGLTPAAYLATQATYRSAFIIINFWFVAAEVGFMVLARRNFIKEYYQDWSPKEVRQQGSAVWSWVLPCQAASALGRGSLHMWGTHLHACSALSFYRSVWVCLSTPLLQHAVVRIHLRFVPC